MRPMTYNKVSVLIPTRGRVERLRKLLHSYDLTTHGALSELVFRVDEDDLPSQHFLSDQHVVTGPRYEGYVSMSTFFNELAAAATGDVLMCGNDDMVFRTPGWPEAILVAANEYPDGLFDFGVTTHNQEHYPFSIVSRKAVTQMGYLWNPNIFWGDIFLRDVMATFGRCIMLPTVQIDHDWAGNNPDAVFLEGNEHRIMPRGDWYWGDIHRPAVIQAVEKLEGLL